MSSKAVFKANDIHFDSHKFLILVSLQYVILFDRKKKGQQTFNMRTKGHFLSVTPKELDYPRIA